MPDTPACAAVILAATVHDRSGKGRQKHQGHFGRFLHCRLAMGIAKCQGEKNDRFE